MEIRRLLTILVSLIAGGLFVGVLQELRGHGSLFVDNANAAAAGGMMFRPMLEKRRIADGGVVAALVAERNQLASQLRARTRRSSSTTADSTALAAPVIMAHEAVPRIIHQTWKNDMVHRRFVRWIRSWADLNPGWRYMFWSDEESRKLVARQFPQFLEMFDSFPKGIERSDASRYFILSAFGGLYIDMDFEALQPLSTLLARTPCGTAGSCVILGQEPYPHARVLYDRDHVPCNAAMLSTPGHPFWSQMLRLMKLRWRAFGAESSANSWGNDNVLALTGPHLLSDAVDLWNEHEAGAGRRSGTHRQARGDVVVVVDPEVFFPWFDAGNIMLQDNCRDLEFGSYGLEKEARKRREVTCDELRKTDFKNPNLTDASWGVHHWSHTWLGMSIDHCHVPIHLVMGSNATAGRGGSMLVAKAASNWEVYLNETCPQLEAAWEAEQKKAKANEWGGGGGGNNAWESYNSRYDRAGTGVAYSYSSDAQRGSAVPRECWGDAQRLCAMGIDPTHIAEAGKSMDDEDDEAVLRCLYDQLALSRRLALAQDEADKSELEAMGGGIGGVSQACFSHAFNTTRLPRCLGWRQTGGCTPDGVSEPESDHTCDATIAAGWSGRCECVVRTAAMVDAHYFVGYNCEHERLVCNDVCLHPLASKNTTLSQFTDGVNMSSSDATFEQQLLDLRVGGESGSGAAAKLPLAPPRIAERMLHDAVALVDGAAVVGKATLAALALMSTSTYTRTSSGCVGWRQTGSCDPHASREIEFDVGCDTQIAVGWSGYCECLVDHAEHALSLAVEPTLEAMKGAAAKGTASYDGHEYIDVATRASFPVVCLHSIFTCEAVCSERAAERVLRQGVPASVPAFFGFDKISDTEPAG